VDPWTIGIVVVLVIGVTVIAYGAIADRRRNKRAAAEMLSPPDRAIPHFAPESAAPTYLSDLQARRRPSRATAAELTEAQRADIRRRLADPTTVSVAAGMASLDFVTDKATTWAVLDSPYVLVCAEPVTTVREILSLLEKVLPTGSPLVIVAPTLRDEVRSTLEVNAIQQTMSLIGVEADGDDLTRIARATATEPVPRADLVSGWVSLDRLGRCDRWVSTSRASHVLISAEVERGVGHAGRPDAADDRQTRS
jgi:hypothetical protein